jgi:hypothetical protein
MDSLRKYKFSDLEDDMRNLERRFFSDNNFLYKYNMVWYENHVP